MTRTALRWSWKISTWALVCMVAIAASEDLWPIVPPSSNSAILIVAFDEDDTEVTGDRMPACASSSAGCTSRRSYVRKATDVIEPVDIRSGSCVRRALRGPPDDRSNNRRRLESLCSKTAAVDTAVVVAFRPAATRYHASLEVQTLDDPSRQSIRSEAGSMWPQYWRVS
jgi:hypothetical protein